MAAQDNLIVEIHDAKEPKKDIVRPILPVAGRNPMLLTLGTNPLVVKFQTIVRDTEEIIVARLKIPTVTSHAFILRRFDTGAVSASTMFKAVFPDTDEESEKSEMAWIKASYDVHGSNGVGPRRLAGVWIPADVALSIAENYGIVHIVTPLLAATPPSNMRKPSRAATDENPSPYAPSALTPSKPVSKGTASPSKSAHKAVTKAAVPTATSPPTKRRRGESPATTASAIPVTRSTRSSASPTRRTRRSLAAASPATTNAVLPKSTAFSPTKVTEPILEEEVDEEAVAVQQSNVEADIAESKQLVATLKAAKEAVDSTSSASVVSVAVKRTLENEPQLTLTLHPNSADADEIQHELEERKIATNRRVRLIEMTPTRKAAAWGSLAFAIGLGAVAFFPNLL